MASLTTSTAGSKDLLETDIDIANQELEEVATDLLDLSDDTITILVGSSHKKYTVHCKQLKRSPFFEKAIKEPWLMDRTISLPIDDPNTVRNYLHFLYASDVPATNYEELAALYVYGEKVMDSRFKHAVVKALIRSTRQVHEDGKCYFPVTNTVNCIYAGTLDGSPARKLLVDIFACHGNPSWMGEYEYDPSFLKDLVVQRMQESQGYEDWLDSTNIVAERYLEEHV